MPTTHSKYIPIEEDGDVKVGIGTSVMTETNIHTGSEELRVFQENHICNDNTTTTPLGIDEEFLGDWQDALNYNEIRISVITDQDSAYEGLEFEWSNDGINKIEGINDKISIIANKSKTFSSPRNWRWFRIRYTNGPIAQTLFNLTSQVDRGASKGSMHIIQDNIVADDDAILTKSVITAEDDNGTFTNVKNDLEGNLRVNSFPYLYSIAEGAILNHTNLTKFGANGNTSTSQTIVSDLAQASYPYLTSAEILQISSTDINDQGLLVSSGTATGGTTLTLIDTGATFVTDGVAIGDLLINDTKSAHGVITVVTQTQLTVQRMDDTGLTIINESGDTYRVANANDTGAAVVSLSGVDTNYNEILDHIIMNGTTNVATNLSFLRVFRCRVHLVGSSLENEGAITVKNNASTINLAQIKALRGQTLMAQWTVPAGKKFFMTSINVGEKTKEGTEFTLMSRPFGEAFQVKDLIQLAGTAFVRPYLTPKIFNEKTDIEVRSVSGAAAGVVNAGFDGWYEDD